MTGKIARLAMLLAAAALAACLPRPLTEAELSDPNIKARVEAQLRAEPSLDLRYVTIDVHMRVVTISGLVPSWENKVDIDDPARRVRGVDQVMSNLVVQE